MLVAGDKDLAECRILLVATMRNEVPFILEWAIGFTDLVICTNDCIDESPALLAPQRVGGLIA